MRVGIAWDFDVDEYTILDVSDYRTHDRAGEIPADTATWIRTIGRGPHGHGEGPFRYCSLATDVLGWLSVAGWRGAVPGALLARDLVADRRRARRRDHARPRRLRDRRGRHLHHAPRPRAVRAAVPRGRPRSDGEQLVPADWIARVCVRDAGLIEAFRTSDMADPARPDAFYHDKWWVFDGPRGVYTGLGMNGQAILLHRPSRTVIAKFSTFADALDWDSCSRSTTRG